VRQHCSLCRVRVRVAPDGAETFQQMDAEGKRHSAPHRHPRKPYRLIVERPEDLEPDKHDWYPGRWR
jgi:hypothetical protein